MKKKVKVGRREDAGGEQSADASAEKGGFGAGYDSPMRREKERVLSGGSP